MSRDRENRAVKYETWANTALKPSYSAIPKPQPQPQPKSARRPAPKGRNISVIKSVAIMLSVSLMMGIVISRYALISNNNIMIQELKRQIEKSEDEMAHLEIELASLANISGMQDVARQELNMDFPTNEQVVRITLEEPVNNNGLAEIKQKTNWFDWLLDKFNSLEGRLRN
ncbi:MAG TPA: cell division protein FtsL [Clostridia bacterium]|nr:cell division protein FtsL [Clostridia bacterium]